MRKAGDALRADSYRIPRWIFAFGVLLACVCGFLGNKFAVCDVETATNKDGTTVTKTCDGPSVTDASVVAIALLIVLVLTPDMSEVGIFGVSLKRRLAAAEQKASDSEAKAERVENQLQMQNLRVDNLAQSVATANAQGIGNLYIMTGEKLEDVDSGLREKAKTFNWDTVIEQTLTEVQPSTTKEPQPDPALVSRIIQNWEIIAASLDLPPYRPGRGGVPRVAVTAEQANRFRTVFAEELQVVRAARNTAAHFQPISNDELRKAVDISEQLLEILRRDPTPDPVGVAAPVS